jgi:hypothetical protein
MSQPFVRRNSLILAGMTAATLLTACEDKRVKQLDTGITRDSALSVMSHDLKPGSGPDSLPNVYRRARYLVNGKNLEVLFFTSNDEKAGKDSVPTRKLTPIVFLENKLIGRGWDFLDSLSKADKIDVVKR